MVRDAMVKLLSPDYCVLTAGDGMSALELVQADPTIAIVLSDLAMPRMDGLSLLRTLHTAHPRIVTILISGRATLESASQAINEGGVYRIMSKPCSMRELSESVDQAAARYMAHGQVQELLDGTREGVIQLLGRLFAKTRPAAYERSLRAARLASQLAARADKDIEQMKLAGALAGLGWLTIPDAV